MKVETKKLLEQVRQEKAKSDLDEYNVQQDIRENEERKGRKGRS